MTPQNKAAAGPLQGLKVIEMAGLAPGPFAAMMLADMGAEVTVIARPQQGAVAAQLGGGGENPLRRGKRVLLLDLKQDAARAEAMALVARADALIEGNRPGVMERLGLGPAECAAHNPRLVYGRMTGWGQTGPLAQAAGHDLNYVALSGLLGLGARPETPPRVPPTVLGDAGGALALAFGIVSAVLAASRTGAGQVVDAAMVDGAALLLTPFFSARNSGFWGPRGTNHLDTGSHFYEVYECADGGWVAVGAIEPHFYAALLEGLGLVGDGVEDPEDPAEQMDPSLWPAKKERFAAIFRTRTRDEWCSLFAGRDACVAPVLSPEEAPAHPHAVARSAFLTIDGVPQPAPAPRFSVTPENVAGPPHQPGDDTDSVLSGVGYSPDELAALRDAGAIF